MIRTFSKFHLQKSYFAGAQTSKILVVVVESEGVAIFFRPCRGPLAGACVALWQGKKEINVSSYWLNVSMRADGFKILAMWIAFVLS